MFGILIRTARRDAGRWDLLPEKFTMPELHRLYEAVVGTRLDRRNFQRKMLALEIVERLPERQWGVPHRAPNLYRFRPEGEVWASDESA